MVTAANQPHRPLVETRHWMGEKPLLNQYYPFSPGILPVLPCKRRRMRRPVFMSVFSLVAISFSSLAAASDIAAPQSVIASATFSASARPSAGLPRSNGITPSAVDPATLCETAVTTAEYNNRLPARLLGAISVTETGRVDPSSSQTRPWAARPWPWTINAEGEGQYFPTKSQAIAAVRALQARGVQSIDVGCLQVNLMFHPHAFASLEEAFEPRANANYAARFLNGLYAEGKDWLRAIGAYHSATPAMGDAYRILVLARWQNAEAPAAPTLRSAYRDPSSSGAYAAFAPQSQVYGAFPLR